MANSNGTIEVTATANETGGSGVRSYEFQYKTSTSGSWITKEVVNSTESSYTYTYTEMGNDKTVYIRVLVTDGAENTGKSAEDNTNGTSVVIPRINTEPKLQIVGTPSKTTESITVVAKATDDENDTLIYTLYVSTNNTNWGTAKAISGITEAGTEVTLTANELKQYTDYYIKVTVEENATSPNLSAEKKYGSPTKVRTYCSGKGAVCTYTTKNCTNCNGYGYTCGTVISGSGLLARKCGLPAQKKYHDCGQGKYTYWQCANVVSHGNSLFVCQYCKAEWYASDSVDCKNCDKTGKVTTCTHRKNKRGRTLYTWRNKRT